MRYRFARAATCGPLSLFLAFSLVFFAPAARAEVVRDLYAAKVPVADQGAAALSAGARDALAQVLVKASGTDEVLSNPTISSALQEARSQVQQYVYLRGGPEGETLEVRYEFAPDYVTGLIKRAGAPLWTANRPQVLVWMVMEQNGERYLVGGDSAPQEALQVAGAFSARGVPLQLPLYDLADRAALDTQSLWRLQGSAIQGASLRYGLPHIVAARVAVLNDGRYAGDWSYFSPQGRSDLSITGDSFAAFLRDGVASVAADLAAQFAVAAAGDPQGAISIRVRGVRDYADYAQVVSWLRGLELIDSANVDAIAGDVLSVSIQAQAEAAQLAPLIELNSGFVPQPALQPDAVLEYQWQRK